MKFVKQIGIEHGFFNLPVQVKDVERRVGLEYYNEARARNDTSEYWKNHYWTMRWCYGRYFENRMDYWPGLGNEWFYEVANAAREVFERTLRPVIPFEEKEDADKIKVGKGFAIYYANEYKQLEDGDELLFNSMNGKSIPKTVIVEDRTPFGTNYLNDVSLKLYLRDIEMLYNGRLFVKRKDGDVKKQYIVPIEKNAQTHVRSENDMPVFFADYQIDQIAKGVHRLKPVEHRIRPSSVREDADAITQEISSDSKKEIEIKPETEIAR